MALLSHLVLFSFLDARWLLEERVERERERRVDFGYEEKKLPKTEKILVCALC